MVLWIVMVMTALVAIVGQTNRLNWKVATGTLDQVRCRWACRAGTESAIAVLNDDLRDTDCLQDLWSDNDDYNNVQVERCAYSVRVVDEASKLNVNTATKEQLMALPYMEENIADAILDWRDGDEEVRMEGAEAGYYENLPFPYTIRNGPFKTIRELLRVKGVTADLLYGEDANLNGQLDFNEMDGALSPPMDNSDDYLDQGWIAYLTCYSYERNVDAEGNNRININQADERQLETDLGITAGQARWIVQNRGQGYRSIGDLVSSGSPQQTSGGQSPNQGDQSNQGNQGRPSNRGNQGNRGNRNDQTQAEPLDFQTFARIADRITIHGESQIPGRININTAPWEVLVVLFGGGEQAEQAAYSVVSERAGLLYGFQSIADLVNVQSVGLERFKAVADQITVRSDVFRIRCFAAAAISGAKMQTECVVDRSQTPCTILYSYQGANY
ncbi:MAG: general secretion pathway protein GspK [Sedimentisphaerales bacterium]|nr:general secretion pathway protein GspK [Sedimentisphaerales bacterium]